MRSKGLLVLAAITAGAALCQAQDDEYIPDLGTRRKDGFLVRCYWVGEFELTKRARDQGVVGVFGQALTPLSYDKHSTATFILTEEVDNDGKMRLKVRVARWSSKVSNCFYWSKAGQHVRAGPGGAGGGDIAPKDINVKASEGSGTVSIDFGIDTTGDDYRFDVRYAPLEIKGLKVRVSDQEKTERWTSDVGGIVASDEPVKPGKKTVIRQELGDPKTNFYSKWIVTRVCEKADVHLVEPRGTQKQYTFSGAQPGVLDVVFKAAATPGNANILQKMKNRVQFKIAGIGNSKMEWDAANPGGKAIVENGFLTAKVKFIGLPAKNDDLGKKTVELLVDGNPVETASVKVFFPKNATNHPGGTAGDPNWFYYWKEGNVCGIRANDLYEDAEEFGASNAAKDKNILLGRNAPEANDGPDNLTATHSVYGSVTVTGHGKGIKCVAETIEHELHHIAIYEAYHRQIVGNPQLDPDRDNIPTPAEAALDGIKSDPANGDTFNLVSIYDQSYATYGDEDVRCRKKELKLTIPYHVEKDWANPGCQTRPDPYGP